MNEFTMNDDDYWNSKELVGYDFGDSDNWASTSETSQSKQDFVGFKKFHSAGLRDCVEKESVETKIEDIKPQGVRSLIEPASSMNIEQQVKRNGMKPTPSQTVLNMVLGLSFTLEFYKGIDEKIALLESALKMHDGNAIIAVILFLRDTLRKPIFQHEIMQHTKAVDHYLHYLFMDEEYDELFDMMMMISHIEDAALMKYKLALCMKSPERKFENLEKCFSFHFRQFSQLLEDNLSQHISLLQWQLPIEKDDERQILEGSNEMFKLHPKRHSLIDVSVISTLFYCCFYHYNLSENNFASPGAVRKHYQLSDKQFVWTAMSALCQLRNWSEIENLFINKGWLGKIKLNCCIGFNKAVLLLANAGAPSQILLKYIQMIDGVEERLHLAKKHKFHQLAMKILTSMRDKEEFLTYRAELSTKSVEYIEVQEVLNSSNIKWKS